MSELMNLAKERERWVAVADKLRERCKTLCASDLEGREWHNGYRFALAEFAIKLRNNDATP